MNAELIDLIYDAISDASKWSRFLAKFVDVVGCRCGSLALLGSSSSETAVVCWHGWTDDDIQEYAQRYRALDPWGVAGSQLPEGAVHTSEELCPPLEFENSIVYREFYAPRDSRYGFGGTILRVGERISAISVARSKDAGPCGESEKAILRPLIPHLRRAALLHGEMTSLRTRLAAFTDHLDRYPHALLLVSAERCVFYTNSAAREVGDARDGVILDAGRIFLANVDDDALFLEAIAAVASDRKASVRRIETARDTGKRPYRLLVLPVPLSKGMPLGVSQPTAAVLIIDSDAAYEPDPEALRTVFALTIAEAKVAAKLAQGRSAEEISGETGTSVETVRTHIRRLLSKTSTSRQGEFISLVLRTFPFRKF